MGALDSTRAVDGDLGTSGDEDIALKRAIYGECISLIAAEGQRTASIGNLFAGLNLLL